MGIKPYSNNNNLIIGMAGESQIPSFKVFLPRRGGPSVSLKYVARHQVALFYFSARICLYMLLTNISAIIKFNRFPTKFCNAAFYDHNLMFVYEFSVGPRFNFTIALAKTSMSRLQSVCRKQVLVAKLPVGRVFKSHSVQGHRICTVIQKLTTSR